MINEESKKQLENFMYNIVWLRNHNKLSKKKMSEILEISLWQLNKIEKGIFPKKIQVEMIFSIWHYFGIHPAIQFSKKLKK